MGSVDNILNLKIGWFIFDYPEFAWWHASWLNSQTINITGAYIGNYTHKIIFNGTNINHSLFASGGIDIRFINGSDATTFSSNVTLPHFIETWNTTGGNSTVYVKTDLVTDKIVMFFNNPGAVNTSSGLAFLIYDNFDNNILNTTNWNSSGTAWTNVAGRLNGSCTGGGGECWSNAAILAEHPAVKSGFLADNYTLSVRHTSLAGTSATEPNRDWYTEGDRVTGATTRYVTQSVIYIRAHHNFVNTGDINNVFFGRNGGAGQGTVTQFYTRNVAYLVEIRHVNNTVEHWLNGTRITYVANIAPAGGGNITFELGTGAGTFEHESLDDLKIYRTVVPEPTYTFGGLQTFSGAGSIDDIFSVTQTQDANVYETNATTYLLNITFNQTKLNNITAFLVYNNSRYNASATNGSNATVSWFNLNVSITPDLLDSNNTAITFNWNYTARYLNGTNTTTAAASNTQNTLFAYGLANLSLSKYTGWIEGEIGNATVNVTFNVNPAVRLAIVNWNGTNRTGTLYINGTGNELHNSSFLLPILGGTDLNATLTLTSHLNVTFNGITKIRNPTYGAVSLFYQAAQVRACQVGDGRIVNVSTRQYDNSSLLPTNNTAYFTVRNLITTVTKNFTFTFNGTSNYEVCLAPNNTNLKLTYDLQSRAGGYNTVEYHAQNETPYNINFINLLLPLTPVTTAITVTIIDQADAVLINYVVEVYRWDGSSYTFIDSKLTDFAGQARFNLLITDTYYKFVVKKDAKIVHETGNFIIINSALTIRVQLGAPSIIAIIQSMQTMTGSFAYNTATRNLTWTWSDPSNVSSAVCFKVLQINASNISNQITLSCSGAKTGTTIYNIANVSAMYQAIGFATSSNDTNNYTIAVKDLDLRTLKELFGFEGVIIALFMIGTLGAMMSFNVNASLVAMMVGIILTQVMGLWSIGWGSTMALFALMILIMVKVSGRER